MTVILRGDGGVAGSAPALEESGATTVFAGGSGHRTPLPADVSGVYHARDILFLYFEIRGNTLIMIASDVHLAEGVEIRHPDLVNLYGCEVGTGTRIGTFVEIQKRATIGQRCKISSHSFICSGVTIEDEVFIGHGVMFTNDLFPQATSDDGALQTETDWHEIPTRVCRGASVGSNVTILAGVTVGAEALIGAGAVVTQDVPPHSIVTGVPARVVGDTRERGPRPTGETPV
jgi:UDP-2-acetamido-3-amino-2,3-dideoxy-glucuronate N-acetyltransferase